MKKNTTPPAEMQLEGTCFDLLVRQGAQQILHSALEIEVADYIEKHGRQSGRGLAVRNGYAPAREIFTGIGKIEIRQPRIDDRQERETGSDAFTSEIIPKYARGTQSLDVAIPALYLAGVSTKDMAKALQGLVGPDARNLSASVIHRLTLDWQSLHIIWSQRSLGLEPFVYLWAAAIPVNVRLEDDNTCLLVIIGVRKGGKEVLLAVMDGFEESEVNWKELQLDLRRRGMVIPPSLAIGDGGLGFWAELREVFPGTK